MTPTRRPNRFGTGRRQEYLSIAVAAGLAACATLLPSGSATSADRLAPAAVRGVADPARDVVYARRNLMAAVGRNMDGITGMIEPGGTLDPADATEHADEIAVLLLAFAELFPPGSDNWSARRERDDPAGVSEALPRVWKENAAFRALARSASQQATDASRAADAAQFRLRVAELDATCNACHAHFRREEKAYMVPIAPLR